MERGDKMAKQIYNKNIVMIYHNGNNKIKLDY